MRPTVAEIKLFLIKTFMVNRACCNLRSGSFSQAATRAAGHWPLTGGCFNSVTVKFWPMLLKNS
jgi:hypothetical protein